MAANKFICPLIDIAEYKENWRILTEVSDISHESDDVGDEFSLEDVHVPCMKDTIAQDLENGLQEIEEVEEDEQDGVAAMLEREIPTLKERQAKIGNTFSDYTLPNKLSVGKTKNAVTEHCNPNLKLESGTEVPNSELILTFSLHARKKSFKTQTFEVLTCQPLTALRDRLYCLGDHIGDGPDIRSGCFVFENCVYDDLRSPDSISYSDSIITQVRRVGNVKRRTTFFQKSMSNTRFVDLKLRLNARYVYLHQGECYHHLVLTDIRKHDSKVELPFIEQYPNQVFQVPHKRRICDVCAAVSANYVCFGDGLAPRDPFMYCAECYHRLHYDNFNELIYDDFEVYPYFHDPTH
eukprot:TRINITY_DN15103_c0_g1_i1.p1 TRINITY_DN15103_c0_g1~~TRINITY_DN15103_c0_g1_i1.p1  ORF type:complete len:351 (+),score=46.51 TRINITY_DN15103_c0_g1_i1:53-1105(+)